MTENQQIYTLMPTIEEFESKTIKAFELQPQVGEFAFLPGKGWGTEIAIQYPVYKKTNSGYIERKKNPICFQNRGYRSHSDFEMYGMQMQQKSHYTPEFYSTFGAQECFETTKIGDRKTEDIAQKELWDNTEITILPNGKKITTLSIEYLLVEKLIEKLRFEEPDNHGRDISDAAALALIYDDIDKTKVREIFTKNFIDFQVKKLEKELKKTDVEFLEGFKNAVDFITLPRKEYPSRYDLMIKKLNLNPMPYDNLRIFMMFCGVDMLRKEDYIPLMAIHNDPESWKGSELTQQARNKIKETMILATQKSMPLKKEDIQKKINEYLFLDNKLTEFFQKVDQKKEKLTRENQKQPKEDGKKQRELPKDELSKAFKVLKKTERTASLTSQTKGSVVTDRLRQGRDKARVIESKKVQNAVAKR